MAEASEILDFRILICLLRSDEHRVAMIQLAKNLEERRYTITRAIDRLEKKGLVKRTDAHVPFLTEQGIGLAQRNLERFHLAKNRLLFEGVRPEKAVQDAYCWAIYGSDEMMDVIRADEERNRVKQELKDQDAFSGELLCSKLKDGIYSFPFVIYREVIKKNNNLSMANSGFENPCVLYVNDGEGYIQLRRKSMSRVSRADGSILTGRVSKLEYETEGEFKEAEIHDDIISFPAKDMQFVNMGSGANQVLHGTTCLRMRCSCGIVHMPESRALFTILI